MTRRQLFATIPIAAALKRANAAAAPFERIDTHTHIHRRDPALLSLLEQADWRCLSICVSRAIGDEASDLEEMIRGTIDVHQATKGRIAWATAFDARGFESRVFAGRVIASLQQSFGLGAVAVKIWKNIGMGIRAKSGEYLLPDHPALSPVFDAIEKAGRTLIAHLAEPDGAWLPLDAHNPEVNYYTGHPEWHMYGRPGVPSKDAILAARDRVLARHPKLRLVGCHLGSDEEHLDLLAKRLDTFPNFAVDVAARVRYFVSGDHTKAREFLLKYQDRVLYATDFTLGPGDGEDAAKEFQQTHERDWKFFATRDELSYRNRQVQGLGLPENVVRKIFRQNAVRWIPGIAG
ncbi:MAG: amidohydrolase [Acidobacteriia bacterium]|nr:amidohydrolase [Terriglobia bacterium]